MEIQERGGSESGKKVIIPCKSIEKRKRKREEEGGRTVNKRFLTSTLFFSANWLAEVSPYIITYPQLWIQDVNATRLKSDFPI